MGGRGIATAAALIVFALVCISLSRKIATERREQGRFPRKRLPLVIGGAAIGVLVVTAIVIGAVLR